MRRRVKIFVGRCFNDASTEPLRAVTRGLAVVRVTYSHQVTYSGTQRKPVQYDHFIRMGQDINLVIIIGNIDFVNVNSEYCPWKNADTLYFLSIYL